MKPAAFNPYIDERLEHWALWALGRRFAGSSTCCMTGLIEIHHGEFIRTNCAGWIPINPDAEEIEYILTHHLPAEHRALIVEHYLMHGTISQKCRRLACSRSTYYMRLRLAFFRVQCELQHGKPVVSRRKTQKCA